MQAKWTNFFNNYRTSTNVFNKEHQEQHQDIDAATRMQSISHGFIFHLKAQQDHAEEILHFNNLLYNFMNDFEMITIFDERKMVQQTVTWLCDFQLLVYEVVGGTYFQFTAKVWKPLEVSKEPTSADGFECDRMLPDEWKRWRKK
eukprot:12012321-Ditylum_brightwellii.AAC.1